MLLAQHQEKGKLQSTPTIDILTKTRSSHTKSGPILAQNLVVRNGSKYRITNRALAAHSCDETYILPLSDHDTLHCMRTELYCFSDGACRRYHLERCRGSSALLLSLNRWRRIFGSQHPLIGELLHTDCTPMVHERTLTALACRLGGGGGSGPQ